MMCYKDKTFCSFWKICQSGINCHSALTPKIIEAAEKSGLLISQFVEEPPCFEDFEDVIQTRR